MTYTVILQSSAEQEFLALPPATQRRVRKKLLLLEREPRPRGCVKLKQEVCYRVRAGDYRILYDVHDKERRVVILAIGHRREVYR